MGYLLPAASVVLLMSMLYSIKRHPAFCALCSGVFGVGVLVLANYFGFGIGINFFTCGVCAVLGAPGAVGLLGLKVILNI